MNTKYLLFFCVISFTSAYCIDSDIFKEMLTLSTPVEAQENKSEELKNTVSEHDCIITQCKPQHDALDRVRRAAYVCAADEGSIVHHVMQLQRCMALYCVHK